MDARRPSRVSAADLAGLPSQVVYIKITCGANIQGCMWGLQPQHVLKKVVLAQEDNDDDEAVWAEENSIVVIFFISLALSLSLSDLHSFSLMV